MFEWVKNLFRKKEELQKVKPVRRVARIEGEDAKAILALYDNYVKEGNAYRGKEARFVLWEYIQSCVPKLRSLNAPHTLDSTSVATYVRIVEMLGDESSEEAIQDSLLADETSEATLELLPVIPHTIPQALTPAVLKVLDKALAFLKEFQEIESHVNNPVADRNSQNLGNVISQLEGIISGNGSSKKGTTERKNDADTVSRRRSH